MKNNTVYSLVTLFAIIFFAENCIAEVNPIAKQKYYEMSVARGNALDQGRYVPSVTFGSFKFQKQKFQITMGGLNKGASRQESNFSQELKDFFYIGPQQIMQFKLGPKVYTELGLAILTGSLYYRVAQTNSSSFREGMFLGIQPKAKLLVDINKTLNLIFDVHYIMTSADLENKPASIGPSIGIGLRYNFRNIVK